MAFELNNPELQAIQDPELRKQLSRQALFSGLSSAGASLLQNADQGGAKAFGAAIPQFTQGLDQSVSQGILVNEKRQKAIAEAKRKERINNILDKLDPNSRDRAQLGLDTGIETITSDVFKSPENFFNKGNRGDFTIESQAIFEESGKLGDLRFRDTGKSLGGGLKTADRNLLQRQAELQFAASTDPATGKITPLVNSAPKIQALFAEAVRLIDADKANVGNAISKAARKLNIDVKDLKNVKPSTKNVDFNSLPESK